MRMMITKAMLPLFWLLVVTVNGQEVARIGGFPDYETCYQHGQRIAIREAMKGKTNISFTCTYEGKKPH